jgi:hypothetical protein
MVLEVDDHRSLGCSYAALAYPISTSAGNEEIAPPSLREAIEARIATACAPAKKGRFDDTCALVLRAVARPV